ncbi:complement C1q tumor necrosis factor-related protein 4-like [Ptychodera flava]|uniref:complement C1q tumor necrosis factor-related protein 4-like n=1 Tax=Ptychodera flava TaxID=63121 RepID=UPI00396A1C48
MRLKSSFSAIRTQPLLGNKVVPQVVTFQQWQATKGDDFNADAGVFSVSIPGIYYFSFTMRTYDNKYIGVTLVVNDAPVVAMTTDSSDRKVMQTQSAMVHLASGDQVWLMMGPSEHFALYGNNNKYTTFNGHLLYPDYEE